MSKQLPINETRTLGYSIDRVADAVEVYLNTYQGKAITDTDGSMTIKSYVRTGNEFAIELEFQGQKKIFGKTFSGSGSGSGSLTLKSLGATTTSLNLAGTATLDGGAAVMPNALINKILRGAVDDLVAEFKTVLDKGVAGSGPDLAA